MSLINDALKRAKQAQQETPPPPAPNLELRPVEAAQCTRRSFGLLVPAALVCLNWNEIRVSNGPMLKEFASLLDQALEQSKFHANEVTLGIVPWALILKTALKILISAFL